MLYRGVDLDSRVALYLYPIHISRILAGLIQILLGEKTEEGGGLRDVPADLADTFIAGLYAGIHPLQKTRS